MATKAKDVDLDDMVSAGGPEDKERSNPFEDDDPAALPEVEYTIDFSGSELVKEGTYHARVQDLTSGTSAANNRKLVLKFFMPELGRSLESHLAQTKAAAWKTGEVFRALGFLPDDESGQFGKIKRSEVVGRLCMVRVVNKTMERREGDDPSQPPTVLANIDKVYAPIQATKELFADLA